MRWPSYNLLTSENFTVEVSILSLFNLYIRNLIKIQPMGKTNDITSLLNNRYIFCNNNIIYSENHPPSMYEFESTTLKHDAFVHA